MCLGKGACAASVVHWFLWAEEKTYACTKKIKGSASLRLPLFFKIKSLIQWLQHHFHLSSANLGSDKPQKSSGLSC